MHIAKHVGVAMVLLMLSVIGFSQQLHLGKNPYTLRKSAVLELESDNQGLLFPRITDTTLINTLTPPDGMVIFHQPSAQLMVRSGGYWKALTSSNLLTAFWNINGNSNGSVKMFGNTDNFDLPFITNNTERMRILSSGNVGIGTTSPTSILHVKSGTTGVSGVRMENLTSSSATTTGAATLGVDASGNVVRAKAPVYYTGGANGGTATVDGITKIWMAEVANTGTGIQTITIPTNVAFSSIINITLTTKGGTDATNSPIAIVTSNTTTQIVIRVLESKLTTVVLGGNVEGLEAHTNTGTRIYIRIEGN